MAGGGETVTCPLCGGRDVRPLYDIDGHHWMCCRGCTLRFLHPQPDEQSLRAIYDADYYAPWRQGAGDDELETMKRCTFGRYLRLVARYRGRSGGKLLDVGCAMGAMLAAASAAGYEPHGVEVNAAAAEAARRHAADVRCGELAAAGFADAAFDVVTMTDVLEHVREPLATLAEVRRVLVPDGVLLITTPDAGCLGARLLGRHWPHNKLEHLFGFDRRTLRRSLEQAGLEVLAVRPATKCLTPVYFGHVLSRYSPSRLGRLGGRVCAAVGRLWNPRVFMPTGELLAVARRAT